MTPVSIVLFSLAGVLIVVAMAQTLLDMRRLRRRSPPLPSLSDLEASESLRPYGQGVLASPADPPVNHARPTDGDRDGARGERLTDRAGDSRN